MSKTTEPLPIEQEIWPSIDDEPPPEEGGPAARGGFTYQDEVAVGFLLEMLGNADILKVHCETHDDLVIVRGASGDGPVRAEYVQVKAEEPDQLWTIATLCESKKGAGRSLLERSLGRDRYAEASRFRIVTLRQLSSALAPLTYPMDSEFRAADAEEMKALLDELDSRFPNLVSPKGNRCDFWVSHCRWETRHDRETIVRDNQRHIFMLGNDAGYALLIEQVDTLLDELRVMAKTAGELKWVPHKRKKIISRHQILAWWAGRLRDMIDGASRKSGGKLAEKLAAIELADDVRALAIELRRDYAAFVRSPRYMASDEIPMLQARVKSEALTLRTRLLSKQLTLSGEQFHALCVERMDGINDERPANVPDQAAFLKGCLYDIADRCLLRFEPPTT